MSKITDAMVEAALDNWFDGDGWKRDNNETVGILMTGMRAALEAALAVAPKDDPPDEEGGMPSAMVW